MEAAALQGARDEQNGLMTIMSGPTENLRLWRNKGQAAIGNGNAQYDVDVKNGGTLNLTTPHPDPVLTSAPLRVLPTAADWPPLGRESFLHQLEVSVKGGRVEVLGEDGIGKTTLVSDLLHNQAPDASLVYLNCLGVNAPDSILANLFFTFFESDYAIVPPPAVVNKYLQQPTGLVALDHVELSGAELATVIGAAPGCNFLVASTERRLTGLAAGAWVPGLSAKDGAALIARELGRETSDEETAQFEELSHAWDGHPLRLLRCAELIVHAGLPIDELIEAGRAADDVIGLDGRLASTLQPEHRRLLVLLACVFPFPLGQEHVAAIADVPDADQLLRQLRRKRLIDSHTPRFSLRPGLTQGLIGDGPELKAMATRAREHLVPWVQEADVEEIHANCGALLELQRQASRTRDWTTVTAFGRALDPVLALTGQWTEWGNALYATLAAADSAGEPDTEAWGCHQLGVRAFCEEDVEAARAYFARALALRQSIQDAHGAHATEHNVRFLQRAIAMAEEAYDSRWSNPEEPVESFSFEAAFSSFADTLEADLSEYPAPEAEAEAEYESPGEYAGGVEFEDEA